jgi:hypothetical protein
MNLTVAIVAVAVVATIVPWAAALALHRVDAGVTLRGLRNGLIVAAALFAVVFVLEAVLFNAQSGLLVGLVVGLGYFWIGSTLIPIGLLFKSKPAWTTLGAWAAVPVIVVSLGFGYVSYRSVGTDAPNNTTANGTIELSFDSLGGPEPVTASGVATCTYDSAGNMTLIAGSTGNAAVMSTDGRVIQLELDLNANGTVAGLSLTMSGQQSEPTLTLDPGAAPRGGHGRLGGPLPGDFNWTCPR